MGETGDNDTTEKGRTQGVGNILQCGGTGNPTVRVGDMGTFVVNGEEGLRDTHWVPLEYHREASAEVSIQDVGKTWGGSCTVGSGNAVGDYLHK